WLWIILHQPGHFVIFSDVSLGPFAHGPIGFTTGYCLLPWLGVMACGYAFGALLLLDVSTRRKQLLGLGLALVVVFIILRYTKAYGDSRPWSSQEDVVFTAFSFLNCQKYPPSVLFVLMTLGPAICALALFDRECGLVGKFFVVFGRVPLFYYLLHLPLIHGLMVALDYARFGSSPFAADGPWTVRPDETPPGYGVDLPMVCLISLGALPLVFP